MDAASGQSGNGLRKVTNVLAWSKAAASLTSALTHKATLNGAFAIPNFRHLFVSVTGRRAAADAGSEGLRVDLAIVPRVFGNRLLPEKADQPALPVNAEHKERCSPANLRRRANLARCFV